MKKITLKIIMMLMLSMSFQANSATIFLSPINTGGDEFSSSGQVSHGEITRDSTWELELKEDRLVSFGFSSSAQSSAFSSENVASALSSGGDFSQVAQSSIFSFILKAGKYTLSIFVTPTDELSGDSPSSGSAFPLEPEAGVLADGVVNTPIPAAVWLFGSAIAGFIGLTRRKSVIAQV